MRSAREGGPLVIFDRDGNATVARDFSSAATEIEAVDVSDGEYHGYDADGAVLKFKSVNDRVYIERSSEIAYDDAVAQLQRSVGSHNPPEGTLAEMIQWTIQQELDATMIGRIRRRLRRT